MKSINMYFEAAHYKSNFRNFHFFINSKVCKWEIMRKNYYQYIVLVAKFRNNIGS